MYTPGTVDYKKDLLTQKVAGHIILFACGGNGSRGCLKKEWGCGTAATAADCKSAPSGFSGSSPDIPTILARVAQSVEHFVGNEEVTGSNPVAGSISSIRSYHTTPV